MYYVIYYSTFKNADGMDNKSGVLAPRQLSTIQDAEKVLNFLLDRSKYKELGYIITRIGNTVRVSGEMGNSSYLATYKIVQDA